MHEVSVIEEIVETVLVESAKYPDSTVESVSLKIGKLRQFVPEIMKFCYEVATKDTGLENSQLFLEEIPVRIYCRYCNMTITLEEYDFHCPDCNATNVEVISGNELILESIKLGNHSLTSSLTKEGELKEMVKGEKSWK
jgi:hydrogenase nickel incorporation protein HypA/HybF